MPLPSTKDPVQLAELRARLSMILDPAHPLRIALETLPPTIARSDYLVLLRVLVPLSSIRLEG